MEIDQQPAKKPWKPPLPARHGEYLTFIKEYKEKMGHTPTDKVIGAHFYASRAYASRMCRILAAHGLLERRPPPS